MFDKEWEKNRDILIDATLESENAMIADTVCFAKSRLTLNHSCILFSLNLSSI